MRRLVLLAALTVSAPALAEDCPTDTDQAVSQLDAARRAFSQFQEFFSIARVSNGLNSLVNPHAERRPVKQSYADNPSRDLADKCTTPARTPVAGGPSDTQFN